MHMQGSLWIGVGGILAFALVPYLALLPLTRTIRGQFSSGSLLPSALVLYVLGASAFRVALWALVPAASLSLPAYVNWSLLLFVIGIVTAAELKATGIVEEFKHARQ